MSIQKIVARLSGLLILLLTVFILTLGQNYVTPIIMYHSVNPTADIKNKLAVSAETFRLQMLFLKENDYHVLPLEELAALIKENKKLPPQAIAITFDDGYKDVYQYAFPVLKEYRIPATVFIITREVGRSENDRVNWGQLQEMRDSGLITIGSHCLGPEPLPNLRSERELKEQIFTSKKILEEKLGVKVNAFSYPEGRFNAKMRQLVIEAGYKLAVATNPGKRFSSRDIFALKRIRISSNAANFFVFWVETSGYYNFLREHRHK